MDPATEETREMVREAVRGVTKQYDREYYLRCAREHGYITEMWQAMVDQGLLGLGVPDELGGSGSGLVAEVAAMEALSQAGTPPLLFLLTAFARVPIIRYGTDEQRREYVTGTVSGEHRICFAITEPDAGTNSFSMRTLAQRQDHGGFLLSGEKVFISGADEADVIVLVARSTPRGAVEDRREGLSLFVFDTDLPGISLQELNVNLSAADRQYLVHFDDVELPETALIGEEGKGTSYLFDALNPERLMVAAWALGVGDFALAKGVEYAKVRAPFDKPIGAYQAVQHPLARAKANLEAARLMLYEAAATYDRGGKAGPLANMAKLLASEAATNACNVVIQTHGGYAFDADYDVITLWPMARLLEIAPLNNEMILNYVGEHVLGLPRSY